MREKRSISLNRTAMAFLWMGYSIILILLLCMDSFLIANYQKEKRGGDAEVLSHYAETAGNDMEDLTSTLYDIYANNVNFDALSGVLDGLAEYDNVYELDYSLRNKVMLEDKMQGYVIYYSSVENVRYYFDTKVIDVDDIEEIKAFIKNQVAVDGNNWRWFTMHAENKKYALMICKNKNVSLCTIYSLDELEQGIREEMGEDVPVVFLSDLRILGDEELAEELGLSDAVKKGNDTLCYQRKGYYVFGQRLKNSEIWITMAVPITLWSYMSLAQLFLLILTLCTVFAVYCVYRFLHRELVMPIRKLTDAMNRIREGEWDAKAEQTASFTEIQKVSETLTAMVNEIKKQKMLSYEQTIEKQKAQMQYLQLQLKPHFYLNGLKTLNVLAMEQDTAKMQELIMNLSNHLRYLLQSEREMVPLCAEVEYVKNYTQLQQNMTGRAFSIQWSGGEEVNWMVPTLCIQTFLENSFKYVKLGNAQYELVIQISMDILETEEGRFLDIQIHDNGAGYPEQILEEINKEPGEGSVSVGINNLKRRCMLIYEGKAEYYFYNDDGAVSELILPEWEKKNTGIISG